MSLEENCPPVRIKVWVKARVLVLGLEVNQTIASEEIVPLVRVRVGVRGAIFLGGKEALAQVFSCELCEISKNTFLYRTLLVAASKKTD